MCEKKRIVKEKLWLKEPAPNYKGTSSRNKLKDAMLFHIYFTLRFNTNSYNCPVRVGVYLFFLGHLSGPYIYILIISSFYLFVSKMLLYNLKVIHYARTNIYCEYVYNIIIIIINLLHYVVCLERTLLPLTKQ